MIPAACLHRNGSEALIGAGLPAVRSAGWRPGNFHQCFCAAGRTLSQLRRWLGALACQPSRPPAGRQKACHVRRTERKTRCEPPKRAGNSRSRPLFDLLPTRPRSCSLPPADRAAPDAWRRIRIPGVVGHCAAAHLASPRCRQLRGHDGRCHAFSLSADPHAALPWPRVHVNGTTGKCCGSLRSASTQEGLNHETQNLPHASTRPTAPHEGLAHAHQYGEGRPHHAVR